MMEKAVVLVTGSEGYFGSVLCEYLAMNNYYVKKFDLRLDNDVRRYESVLHQIEYANPNYIINLAALVGEELCNKYPERAVETNLMGTINVARLAKLHNAKLIFPSTCSNYGKTSELVNEESPLQPLSLYSQTKVDAENIIPKINDDYTILRFATLFGYSPHMRWDLMVNEWLYDAVKYRRIEVYNPEAYRPFIHLLDACNAILTVMENWDKVRNQIFNVGGINITKRELIGKIAKFLKMDEDKSLHVVGEVIDQRDYQVDFTKFYDMFDWEVVETIMDGLNEMHPRIFTPKFRNADVMYE